MCGRFRKENLLQKLSPWRLWTPHNIDKKLLQLHHHHRQQPSKLHSCSPLCYNVTGNFSSSDVLPSHVRVFLMWEISCVVGKWKGNVLDAYLCVCVCVFSTVWLCLFDRLRVWLYVCVCARFSFVKLLKLTAAATIFAVVVCAHHHVKLFLLCFILVSVKY